MPKKREANEVEHLVDALDFASDALADALLNQPKLFLEAANYKIKKLRVRMAAETRLKNTKTEVAQQIRKRASANDERLTVQAVEEQVAASKQVREALDQYNEAKALEEWGWALENAYRMRGDMAQALVRLVGAEAASESRFLEKTLADLGIRKLQTDVRTRFPAASRD